MWPSSTEVVAINSSAVDILEHPAPEARTIISSVKVPADLISGNSTALTEFLCLSERSVGPISKLKLMFTCKGKASTINYKMWVDFMLKIWSATYCRATHVVSAVFKYDV